RQPRATNAHDHRRASHSLTARLTSRHQASRRQRQSWPSSPTNATRGCEESLSLLPPRGSRFLLLAVRAQIRKGARSLHQRKFETDREPATDLEEADAVTEQDRGEVNDDLVENAAL